MRRLHAAIAIGLAASAFSACSAELIDAFARGIVFAPARAQPSVMLIGLPIEEALRFVDDRPAVVGVGVYPESRRPEAFFDRLWSGSPKPGVLRFGARSPVRRALASAGRSVGIFVEPAMTGNPLARLGEAGTAGDSTTRASTVEAVLRTDFAVFVLPTRRQAERVVARAPNAAAYVVGAGARTPLLVARALAPTGSDQARPGVFTGGIARRRGIVTPDDLAATVLTHAGARSSEIAGKQLLTDRSGRPSTLEAGVLATRLERDDDFGPGLSITIVMLGIASVVLGTAGLIARRGTVAGAFVRGASVLPIGYVAGLFVPDSRWQVRAIPMVALFVLGLLVPIQPAGRFAGRALLVTVIGIAVLTIAAAANPNGEPALSLWGNPLVSWRFFGLRNHLVAFMAGGLLAATALLSASTALLITAGVAAGVIVGAPWLGANFVGVLTLGIGVTIAALGRKAGHIRFQHFPIAAGVGIAGMLLALLADAGSPVSHGGRALDSVRSEGLARAWELFRARARLNYGEVTDLGFVGFLALALVAASLGMLLWWAIRSGSGSVQAKAGVGGVAAAALAALLLEDSGFFTGAITGFFAWVAFAVTASHAWNGAAVTAPAFPPDPARDAGRSGA